MSAEGCVEMSSKIFNPLWPQSSQQWWVSDGTKILTCNWPKLQKIDLMYLWEDEIVYEFQFFGVIVKACSCGYCNIAHLTLLFSKCYYWQIWMAFKFVRYGYGLQVCLRDHTNGVSCVWAFIYNLLYTWYRTPHVSILVHCTVYVDVQYVVSVLYLLLIKLWTLMNSENGVLL